MLIAPNKTILNGYRYIERIQRIYFKIILGPKNTNYKQACQYLSAQTLEDRRVKLCLKFTRKHLKSEPPQN